MKIIFLSDANSIHTFRWIRSLRSNGFEILLFSFFKPENDLIEKYVKSNVKVVSPNLKSKIKNHREPNITKIRYLQSIFLLRNTIKGFRPDILHAHYSSSYGILGYLCGFKPFILSVWGSDITYFPYKNIINKWLTNLIIKSADVVCSTSTSMNKIIKEEYNRFDVQVIPFGIDLNFFKPKVINNKFTVGTIKSIENYNGIDCLIEAAKIVIHDYKKDIDFIIVGGGSLKSQMQQKSQDLNLKEKVRFTGKISHDNIVEYYNELSVFIAVSERESFGVSVLEAAACEVPSITSNIGGLTEVNLHNKTGIIINPKDPKKLAKSIIKLYDEEGLREKLGKKARQRVSKLFDWNNNVFQMVKIYKQYDK